MKTYQLKQPLTLFHDIFIKVQKSILKVTLYGEKKSINRVLCSYEENHDTIRIEMDVDKIWMLFAQHQICMEDLHCLDNHSKQQLRKICLKTCLYRRNPSQHYSDVNNLRKQHFQTNFSFQAKGFKSGEFI